MHVSLNWTSAPLKISSDRGDSVSKKCRRGYGGAYGEVWRSLRLAGAWSRAGQFCVRAFDFSRPEDVFTLNLSYFTKKFYKICIFNAT
jgi:hypothetical protein